MYVNLIWRARISDFFFKKISNDESKIFKEEFLYLKGESNLQLHYLIDIYIYIYIHYLQ